jgi:subtilisin family serine protease
MILSFDDSGGFVILELASKVSLRILTAMTTGSPDVIVAVTDSGVDITHPDLEPNIYTNPNEIPGNGIDDDRNGYIDDVHGFDVATQSSDVSDIHGHGTQMSGIISASLNNEIGISGVSQSKIMPVKFFRRTGPAPVDVLATVADAARALLYSVAAGAKIINASWRTLLTRGEATKAESNALRDAVLATQDAGALLISIAGNDGYNNDVIKVYPSAYRLPNQIVVAASDYSDQMWHPIGNPFFINSGYGLHTVDLTAPGVSIRTTTARGNCFGCSNSDDPEDWYVIIDGTSASAAFVSGVAALVKSLYPDAHASVIRRRILESVERRDMLAQWVITGGRLNAEGALSIELEITPPVLIKAKYKKGNSKLTIDGQKIQYGASVSVNGVLYPAKPLTSNFSRLEAIVPKTDFPARTPVEVFIRNADGGESQRTTIKR